jgi:ketosteroid isomerase-like protein
MERTRYGVPDEIKDAVGAFYRAVSTKNLRAIDNLWCQVPYVAVAGRHGHIQQGWNQVRSYWERRFRQLGDTRVDARLKNVVVHAVGDVGWISGTEIRTIKQDGDAREERLRMTSVLQRTGSRWQLVSYHVSEGIEEGPDVDSP